MEPAVEQTVKSIINLSTLHFVRGIVIKRVILYMTCNKTDV